MSSPSTPTVGPLDPIDATPLPLQAGDLVAGRYEILRLLGSGGSAFVYAVRDRKIGDEIALKLLRNTARSEIDVERTRREAEFARGPASTRLVRTFDLVEAHGLAFLTMELVPGGSLRELRRRGPLPLDDAIRLACEILEALADLHALDVVHRDLKPGNLLLTADGHVKLSDFGIARRWTDEDARLTRTGLPVGTVDYLSPEQAAAEHVDPRADLYSFGVVLFEMLTGRVPFEAPSAVSSLVMRLHRRAEDVRRLRPDVPRWLAAVVARSLETKREDRYASAKAVLEDMRRKRGRPRWGPIRLATAAASVMLSTLLPTASRSPDSSFLRLAADGEIGVRAIDGSGGTLWTRRDLKPQHATIVRNGGARELAAILTLPHVRATDPATSRILSFLDVRTGRVLRTRSLPFVGLHEFREHSDRFGVAQVLTTDLNDDGYHEVVVTYTHDYWPCFIVFHDLHRDEARVLFVASGHHRIIATKDLDGDGVAELIVEGIANRQGWYRSLAALRVPFDRFRTEVPSSTPDRFQLVRGRSLLWYALCPAGSIRDVTVDGTRRVIRVEYETRPPVEMTLDGFDVTSMSPLSGAARQSARERAYAHLRDSVRLADSGNDAAIEEAEAARVLASRAGDAILTEWSSRLKGVALVRGRRFEAGDALFTRLAQSGTVSEIAWDAAHAFHLEGNLPRAVAWYRRSLGREGQPGVGRMKYESVEGAVLALGEMERWSDAVSEIERFRTAFPDQAGAWSWYGRYIAWRRGGTPAASDPDIFQEPIDLYRYWSLEIALARGGDPHQLLRAIDADGQRASETRSLLLLVRVEALRRMGRTGEALEVAREALLRLRAERRTSVLARAHFDLAAERLAALAEAKGLFAEAKQVRAEAAAVGWHPNGIVR